MKKLKYEETYWEVDVVSTSEYPDQRGTNTLTCFKYEDVLELMNNLSYYEYINRVREIKDHSIEYLDEE